MVKWEYIQLIIQLYDENFLYLLNERGSTGWEIVQIVVASTNSIGSTDWVRVIFKRPKP